MFAFKQSISSNAVLICDREQVEELILGLENIDPHYKIIGCECWYHESIDFSIIIMWSL
jgi:hypothetical protein